MEVKHVDSINTDSVMENEGQQTTSEEDHATANEVLTGCGVSRGNELAVALCNATVAGGALVTEKRQTKKVKLLLEETGWLCKSPGHKIEPCDQGKTQIPLTAEGSLALLTAPRSAAVPAQRQRIGSAEMKGAAAELVDLLAAGVVQLISSEDLPPPPLPPLRNGKRKLQDGVADGRKRNPVSACGDTPANRFTFAELFAGIGGFRLGLEAVGGVCSFASEVDPAARQTYAENFGFEDGWQFAGDVTRLHSRHVPDHDMLAAGFPCQSFSSAGRQEGLMGEKGTGYLIFHVVRILREKQPPAFLLENVKGLTTMEGGSTFATVLSMLRGAGYKVWHEVLDSAPLLPQTRFRVYMVGFRLDIAPRMFRFPTLPDLRRQASEVLIDARNHNSEGATPEETRACDSGGSGHGLELSDHQWGKITASNYFAAHRGARLLDPSGPAQTLQSSYRSSYMLYSQFVPATSPGHNPRFFSPRECARLMGFPEAFRLPNSGATGGDSSGGDAVDRGGQFYRQAGNAACPPVVAAIAERMARCLQIIQSGTQGGDSWRDESHDGMTAALRLVMAALPEQARACLVARNSGLFARFEAHEC